MEHTLTLIDADPAGRPGIAVLALRGDVDACEHTSLDALRRRLARTSQVHVDVAGVRFAGATFLGFVAGLAAQAKALGGTLHIHGVRERVVDLLTAVGMEAQFDLVHVCGVTVLRLRPRTPSSPQATLP